MKKGCCCGCLAMAALLAVGAAVLIGLGAYLVGSLGLLELQPRHDTLEAVSAVQPAVLFRADPNTPAVLEFGADVFGLENTRGVDWFLPHELTGLLAHPSGESSLAMRLAVSMRRGAPAVLMMYENDSRDWFGFGRGQTRVELSEPGLLTVESEVPAPVEEGISWNGLESVNAPEVSGNHLAEVLVNNRAGQAYRALAPFLAAPREGPEEEKIEVIKAPFTMDPVRLPGLFRRLAWFHAAVDMPDKDRLLLEVSAESPTADGAEALLMFLYMMHDEAYRALLEQGILLEGALSREGASITGQFEITGFHEVLAPRLRRHIR